MARLASRPKRGALKGARRVRRLLKRLPDTVAAEMAEVMKANGPAIRAYAQAAAPDKSGALRRAIAWKFNARSLSLRVGLLTRAVARRLFYARILEFGRAAQTVTVRRRTRTGRTAIYRLRIKAIDDRRFDFVSGRAYRFARQTLQPDLIKVWQRALAKAAGGGDD
jgi:hypothetical protein